MDSKIRPIVFGQLAIMYYVMPNREICYLFKFFLNYYLIFICFTTATILW